MSLQEEARDARWPRERKATIVLLVAIDVLIRAGAGAWLGFLGPSVQSPQFASTLSDPRNQLTSFLSTDSVLVVAPHPDDECIATGGAIQSAITAGSKVYVVYLTCGDNHELAYWALKKVPALIPSEFRALGEVRRAETVKGTRCSACLLPDSLPTIQNSVVQTGGTSVLKM